MAIQFLIAFDTLAIGLTACALSVKAYGFDSSPKGRALGMAVQFPAKPQSGLPGSTPSVIACGDATFPKGTAFGCGDKVSGSA